MKIIPIDPKQGVVTVKMEITGTPTWVTYYTEDQEYENDASTGRPSYHSLGRPHELVSLDHEWLIKVANPSMARIIVDVKVEWFQEIDGTEVSIEKWEVKDIQLASHEGEIVNDHGFIYKIS